MRAFLALDLSAETRAKLGQVQAALKTETLHVKWVDPDQMHLTLRFFVDLQPEQQHKLHPAMTEVARRSSVFTYKVRGVGFFASGDRLKVLWCGVDDTAGRLTSLQRTVEQSLAPLKLAREERLFRAHLTLGRLKVPSREPQLVQALKSMTNLEAGVERPERVRLYQSTLTPEGPVYRVLAEWRFGAGS